MLMLITGGSLVAGSDNPHFGTMMPLGPSTPSEMHGDRSADTEAATCGALILERRR
jgi:hypothetical protein